MMWESRSHELVGVIEMRYGCQPWRWLRSLGKKIRSFAPFGYHSFTHTQIMLFLNAPQQTKVMTGNI
jgi:hypothetical protein